MFDDIETQEGKTYRRCEDTLKRSDAALAKLDTNQLNDTEVETILHFPHLFEMWERGEPVAKIKAEIMEVWR